MSNTLTDWLGNAGKNLTERVKILHPQAYQDGKVSAWSTQSADALVVRRAGTLQGTTGAPYPTARLTFLLGDAPTVTVGDEIEYNGTRYRISGVEVSRSVSGRVVARRCQVE